MFSICIYINLILPYLNSNHIYYTCKQIYNLKKKKLLQLNMKYSNKYIIDSTFQNIINQYLIVHLNLHQIDLPNFILPNNIINVKLTFSNTDSLVQFTNVKNIEIYGCNNIYDLNDLKNVEVASIKLCQNIIDISALNKCKQVSLNHCKCITNISSLYNVERVFISNCHNIKSFNYLLKAKLLYLTNCDSLIDVSIFKNIQKLYIHHCKNIINYAILDVSASIIHYSNIQNNSLHLYYDK